jgi:hypothetical protein
MKTLTLSLIAVISFTFTTKAVETSPRPSPVVRCIFQLGRLNPELFEVIPANGKAHEISLKEEKNAFGQPQWRGEVLLTSAASGDQNHKYMAKAVLLYRKSASFWLENAGRLDVLSFLLEAPSGKMLAATRTSSDQLPTPTMLERSLKKGLLKTVSTAWNPELIDGSISSPLIEDLQSQWADAKKADQHKALRLDSVCELKE